MKKNYTILLITLLFCGSLFAQEAQKNLINYQGVARNAFNELMANEPMNLGLAIRFGSASSTIAYEETHNLTTDANGVFSLKIGNGNSVSGNYDNLAWGSDAAYVTVSINGSEIGTTELMAVPYAISSGDGDNQSAAEVAYDNSTSNLTATNTQQAIDELAGNGIVDADSDPTNEIQTLSFDVVTNELNLTDGGTVTIPTGGTDADADPTNEFQNLSFDTNTNELSLSDGNSVIIPSGGTDADADPTNELQDISLAGTNLSISDGSTIDLAPILPPVEINGDVLSIENGNGSVDLNTYRDDNDADPTNEHQTLSFDSNTNELNLTDGGSVTLPNGGGGGTDDQNLELNGDVLSIENGNGSVDLATYRDDNDADPTNEHQTLTFDSNTNELSLSDGGSVTLPNGGGGGATSIDELSDGKSDGTSVFLGTDAGENDDGGNNNVAVGQSALATNTIGSNNTAIGAVALYSNVDGNANTANGGEVLYRNTSGSYNTGSGYQALSSNTTGGNNTANGAVALHYNTTGRSNTAVGGLALLQNVSGDYNTAVGAGTLQSNSTGINNTASGAQALFSNTTGGSNTSNGKGSLYSNTVGSANTANGFEALKNNTEGFNNTANGVAALFSNTTGKYNTANGVRALLRNTSGSQNTANGYQALFANIGDYNTANGASALKNNTTGFGNTANGHSALRDNTEGDNNSANGINALNQNTSGSLNVANGASALFQNTTGNSNTGIGTNALFGVTTGNNNIGLGFNAWVPTGSGSNQVQIGNTDITYAGIQVSWTVTSDRRWKYEIRELPYGLNLVSQLRPVDYIRINNEHETREIGFIAQELEAVLNELGYADQGLLTKDDKGFMSLRYNDFIPVLTKAIQEQQEIIAALKNEHESTRLLLQELKEQMNELVGKSSKKEMAIQK